MQNKVVALLIGGRFPDEASASEEWLAKIQQLLADIRTPVTDEEAVALCALFGPDTCFGMSWPLVHLIETAPKWPIREALQGDSYWIQMLARRSE